MLEQLGVTDGVAAWVPSLSVQPAAVRAMTAAMPAAAVSRASLGRDRLVGARPMRPSMEDGGREAGVDGATARPGTRD